MISSSICSKFVHGWSHTIANGGSEGDVLLGSAGGGLLGSHFEGMGDCWLFRHLAVENEDLQILFGCVAPKIRWTSCGGGGAWQNWQFLLNPTGTHRKFRLKISLSKKAGVPFLQPTLLTDNH